MTEATFRDLLGDKYTPATHDYCLSNRRSTSAKKLEGWFAAGEMTNHGEVMVLLARLKPEPPKVRNEVPKPSLTQRLVSAVKGK